MRSLFAIGVAVALVYLLAAPAIVSALLPKVKAPKQPALVGGEAA